MPDALELASRTLHFRPDLRVLVVRWHTEAPLDVVKAEYWQMLAVAVAQELSDWLLDVRRRDKSPVELSTWVNSTFYPEAVAQMASRRLRLAVLSSPFMTQLYTSDPAQKREVAYALDPARPFDIALFEDEGKAMDWLRPVPER
jgi:hypothetical protein